MATPETEGEWVERAKAASQEELERMVKVSHLGDPPPKAEGLPEARFPVRVELDALQWAKWEKARAKLLDEGGFEEGVRDVDVVMEMAELVLASDAEGNVPGRRKVDGSLYRVILAKGDGEPHVVTEDGDVPVAEETFESVASDERVPEALRKRVIARDGGKCRNGAGTRWLNAHHVVWQSNGGRTRMDNLVTLCAKCHGLVHSGVLHLRIVKGAEGQVDFEMRDAFGREVGRRLLVGPRVVVTAAQCAVR